MVSCGRCFFSRNGRVGTQLSDRTLQIVKHTKNIL